MVKIGFPMPTAKNRFQILNLHPKKHVFQNKKVIISTKSFFYSKGTEGRELKLVSSLSAFVYLNIVRGSVNKKKKNRIN